MQISRVSPPGSSFGLQVEWDTAMISLLAARAPTRKITPAWSGKSGQGGPRRKSPRITPPVAALSAEYPHCTVNALCWIPILLLAARNAATRPDLRQQPGIRITRGEGFGALPTPYRRSMDSLLSRSCCHWRWCYWSLSCYLSMTIPSSICLRTLVQRIQTPSPAASTVGFYCSS